MVFELSLPKNCLGGLVFWFLLSELHTCFSPLHLLPYKSSSISSLPNFHQTTDGSLTTTWLVELVQLISLCLSSPVIPLQLKGGYRFKPPYLSLSNWSASLKGNSIKHSPAEPPCLLALPWIGLPLETSWVFPPQAIPLISSKQPQVQARAFLKYIPLPLIFLWTRYNSYLFSLKVVLSWLRPSPAFFLIKIPCETFFVYK